MKQHNLPMKSQLFVWKADTSTKEVCLSGEFNDWSPMPMLKQFGNFQATVKLAPGEYRYKFLVDGQWRNDPENPELVPNGLGSADNLLHVR